MSLKKILLPDYSDPNFLRTIKLKIESKEPIDLPAYTVQELEGLTAANYSGYLVRCSNGNAGAECLAFCNGFRWKIIELGGNVSLS